MTCGQIFSKIVPPSTPGEVDHTLGISDPLVRFAT